MILEIIISGIVFYVIFHDILDAKSEEIRERTRRIDLDNELMEIRLSGEHGMDPEEMEEENVTNEDGTNSSPSKVC